MFGSGVVGNSRDVPQWIWDIVNEVEIRYGFCTEAIYYKEAKQKDYYNGCYNPSNKAVELYFSSEKNDKAVWVLLHEMAHAYQYLECPETLTPKQVGKRNRVVHNDDFWDIAKMFYIRFDVLETAAQNEYKRARKLMVK